MNAKLLIKLKFVNANARKGIMGILESWAGCKLEFCERSEQNTSILCLFAGLTAARINLIFCIHIHIWSDCAIGYMILTFEVIKGHFRSNKFLWLVPQGVKVDFDFSKGHF